jgi:cell wall-associated NlpC family hydrolase
MIDTRTRIIQEARTWIGTPYHDHGGVKGVGVDCAHLLVKVYSAVGLVPENINLPDYTPFWYLHSDSDWGLEELAKYTQDVDVLEVGDILIFKFGRAYSHGCIVSCLSPLTVIHAYGRCGFVVEEEVTLNSDLVSRLSSVKKRAIMGV